MISKCNINKIWLQQTFIPVLHNLLYKMQDPKLQQFEESKEALLIIPNNSYPNTYLGKVANKMTALNIILCQHIEKKWLHIIIESLVIQEEFSQQAQILAVDSADIAINLRDMRKSAVTPFAVTQGQASPKYPQTSERP